MLLLALLANQTGAFPVWSRMIDSSLAVAIACAAGYLIFRLFAATEAARREQVSGFVKYLTVDLNNRLDEQKAAIDTLRQTIEGLREELRNRRPA